MDMPLVAMSRRRGNKSKNARRNNNNNRNNNNGNRVVEPEAKPKMEPTSMSIGGIEIGPRLAPGETENLSMVIANNANVAKLVNAGVSAGKSMIEGASQLSAIQTLTEPELEVLDDRWQGVLKSELHGIIDEREANLNHESMQRTISAMKDVHNKKKLPVEHEIEMVELGNKLDVLKNKAEVINTEHTIEKVMLEKKLDDLDYDKKVVVPMERELKRMDHGGVNWTLMSNFKLRGCELIADGDPEGDDDLSKWDYDVLTYKVEFKGLGFLRLRKNEMVINPVTMESSVVYATQDVAIPYYVFKGLNCWEKFWYEFFDKVSTCFCCPINEPGFYLEQTEDWIPIGRLPAAKRWFFCPDAFLWMMSKKEDDAGKLAQRYIDYYGFKPSFQAYLVITDTAYVACSLKM